MEIPDASAAVPLTIDWQPSIASCRAMSLNLAVEKAAIHPTLEQHFPGSGRQ